MGSISMCPKCSGRLVTVSERTGGFSGTKAVIGAAVVGPVGVAAGALGKQLVVLQCTNCGYQIETDKQTAEEAEQFGILYEQYAKLHVPRIPIPELGKGGYDEEFVNKGCAHRAEERKKIGIDIEAVERNVEQIEEKCDQEIQAAADEISRLEREKEEKTQALGKLGFFKFMEKKTTQETIDSLSEQIKASISQMKDIYRQRDSEVTSLRSEYVERCRVLAHAAVDEYCPDDPVWKEFAHAVYSVMSGEMMSAEEIIKKLNGDITPAEFHFVMSKIGNPFVSTTSLLTTPGSRRWWFGPDGGGERWWIRGRNFRSYMETLPDEHKAKLQKELEAPWDAQEPLEKKQVLRRKQREDFEAKYGKI